MFATGAIKLIVVRNSHNRVWMMGNMGGLSSPSEQFEGGLWGQLMKTGIKRTLDVSGGQ